MPKSSSALLKSANADLQASNAESSFASRLREAAAAKSFTRADLSRASGVDPKRISEYWKGPKSATADNLFPLANALSVSAEWLALGRGPREPGLVEVDDAEFVQVPEHDLRQLDDLSKGPVLGRAPMRRDWLQRSLGAALDVWVARSPADYAPLGIAAGAPLFLRDVDPAGLEEANLCIFRSHGHLLIARFSALRSGEQLAAGGRLGEFFVSAAQIGTAEDDLVPVARILGAPVRSF